MPALTEKRFQAKRRLIFEMLPDDPMVRVIEEARRLGPERAFNLLKATENDVQIHRKWVAAECAFVKEKQ